MQDLPLHFDTLIHDADWIITVDCERRILRQGVIGIRAGRIAWIGKQQDLGPHSADRRVSAKNHIVSPGFVDCHIHTAFQMARGLADGVDAKAFLFDRMYPYEATIDEEDMLISAELCVLELLRNGVTSFIDSGNYRPDVTARIAGGAGMRCAVARSAFDVYESAFGCVPKTFVEQPATILRAAEDTVQRWEGAYNGRVRGWFQFRGLNNASDELIVALNDLAKRHNTGLQTHACFAKSTMTASIKQHGCTEIARLARLKCLGPHVLLVHAGWLNEEDVELLVSHDVKIVAAPSSSMHKAYGNIVQGRVPELMSRGVRIGLGSDHACSGIVNMMQEMFLVSCGYKEARMDPTVLPAEKAIEMATRDGAACALMEDSIGSIEVGKAADLVMFRSDMAEWQPLYNPVSNLVYSATGRSVDAVFIDGQPVMRDGVLLTVDERDIVDRAAKRAPSLLARSGLADCSRSIWPVH